MILVLGDMIEKGGMSMEDSILTSVKSKIGMLEDYTEFDNDIVDYINSVFMILKQLGVGPKEGFSITDSSTTWDEFISEPNRKAELQGVKTYIYQKTKLIFDPPQSSALLEALKQSIAEFEWRLNLEAESSDNEA